MEEILGNDIQIIDDPKRNSFQTAVSDPGFLAAKGKFYGNYHERIKAKSIHVRKLANAIILTLQKNGYAKVRSIGDSAHANAVRAVELASRRCLREKKIQLAWEITREVGNIGELKEEHHFEDIDAMVFSVSTFREKE